MPKGVEQLAFSEWKKCYRLTNGRVDAVIVPAVGRMMSFRLTEGENVLSINPANAGRVPPLTLDRLTHFGGLYTWLAPQAHWVHPERGVPASAIPDPAIDVGPYDVTHVGPAELTMTSPVSKTLGLQAVKTFRLLKDQPRLEFTVTLRNVAATPARWAVWNLTAVRPVGTVFFQVPNGEADLNFFGVADYQRAFNDVLEIIDDRWCAVEYRRYARAGAKLFVKVGSPFLAYRQPKVWFIRTFPADPRAIYTDQQSQIELWADARQEKIFELEVTGPDCLIPPGQDISWTETLHLVADPDPMTDDPYRQVRKLETILSAIRP